MQTLGDEPQAARLCTSIYDNYFHTGAGSQLPTTAASGDSAAANGNYVDSFDLQGDLPPTPGVSKAQASLQKGSSGKLSPKKHDKPQN